MKHFYLFLFAFILTSCTGDASTDSTRKSDLEKKNLNGKIKVLESKVYLGEEKNGKVQKTDTLIAELTHRYNDRGFETSLYHRFYEGGENTLFDSAFPEHKAKREYNKKGLLSKKIFLFDDGLCSEDQFSYDNEGRLIKESKYNTDGEITAIIKYKYNKSGKLITTTHRLPNGRLVEKETIEYKKGKKVLVQKYDHKGKPKSSTKFKYHKDYYEEIGEHMYKKYDYEDRTLAVKTKSGSYDVSFFYDAHGHLIEVKDGNGDSIEQHSYRYDTHDNPIREIFYSYEDGKFSSVVVIETTITYY